MFVSWMILNGLIADKHKSNALSVLMKVMNKEITGLEFIAIACDGNMKETDFNDEGKLFAHYYLCCSSNNDFSLYTKDCLTVFRKSLSSILEVENTWINYQQIKPVIATKFLTWRELQNNYCLQK